MTPAEAKRCYLLGARASFEEAVKRSREIDAAAKTGDPYALSILMAESEGRLAQAGFAPWPQPEHLKEKS